jgi:hypothetical protein
MLKDLSNKATNVVQGSAPPAELGVVPRDLQSVKLELVSRDWFPALKRYFDKNGEVDRKWRKPRVLTPDEFTAQLLRGGVQVYNLITDSEGRVEQAGVIQQKEKDLNVQRQVDIVKIFGKHARALSQFLIQRGAPGPGGGNVPPGVPGPPGGGGGGGLEGIRGGGRASGGGGGGFMPQPQNVVQNAGADREVKFVRVEDLEQNPGKLAETVKPVRMAIISGAFPYRKQLDEFQRALHFDNVAEILSDPEARPLFVGILVQRRTVSSDGKVLNDWIDLDIEKAVKQLRVAAVGLEPEDQKLVEFGVIVKPNHLVMPRPKLSHQEKYPAEELGGIRATLSEFEQSRQVFVPPPPPKPSRFTKDFDPWSEDMSPTPAVAPPPQASSAAPPATPPGSQPAGKGSAPVLPPGSPKVILAPQECLIRFIDVTIEPGQIYEYQVKIRMANPNYGRDDRAVSRDITTEKEIVSDEWTPVTVRSRSGRPAPLRLAVKDELLYYAVDERGDPRTPVTGPPANQERAAVQVHRWLDEVQVGKDRESVVPVGDWSVLERLLVHRGEYVGRVEELEVPVWDSAQDGFSFAIHPDDVVAKRTGRRTIRHKGIPVDFASDPLAAERDRSPASVLVDFEGGKRAIPGEAKATEEVPVEMLVLTPDGKLLVHTSTADTNDGDRRRRYLTWKERLDEVRFKGKKPTLSGRPDDSFRR